MTQRMLEFFKSTFWYLQTLMFLIFLSGLNAIEPPDSLRPDWVKDLVIYEVATKGFTSPSGPESGTFLSLKAKMPYLQELGINAIWLTGHSLSDSNHFYGIWTQYACIEPDKLDPSLGSETDFKEMVAEAHRRGIRIFLDTIEHGVMNYSPIINEHPDWFKGGSWGMTDYDWDGDHPDLDEWWVNMWTKAVLEWGVDGFRCDMGLHRPDLWQVIKQRCADAGKPIFILGESGLEDVSDANQRDIMLFNQRKGILKNHAVLTNLPSVKDLFHRELDWDNIVIECEVFYDDSTVDTDVMRGGKLDISFLGLGDDVIGNWEYEPDGKPDWNWLLTGVDTERKIKNIVVACPERNWHWQSEGWGWKLADEQKDNGLIVSGGNPLPGPKLRVISPSCHDCGWDGFPLDKNPYTTQGSRHVMGYGTLFAPAIPIIMSGDEFDAEYKPLPKHTPGLFGEGESGTGRWLYASWIQWDQLNDQRHEDMFNDVKRMMAIRSEHKDLIHAISPGEVDVIMNAVPYKSEKKLPTPYILNNSKRALLVVGNPTENNVEIEVEITVESLGLNEDINTIMMTELWPVEGISRTVNVDDLLNYKFNISADGNTGGGLKVVRFEYAQ